MSLQNRGLTSGLRHPSIGGSFGSSGQSPTLIARINEKRAELENLKQLRDLSADLAAQMQALEYKLTTLSNGTEGMFSSHSLQCTAELTSDQLLRQSCRIGTMSCVLSIWPPVSLALCWYWCCALVSNKFSEIGEISWCRPRWYFYRDKSGKGSFKGPFAADACSNSC